MIVLQVNFVSVYIGSAAFRGGGSTLEQGCCKGALPDFSFATQFFAGQLNYTS